MRISLIIPCHNEEKTLHRSIASWLSQTRPADEIIVVDDASSDGSPAILKEYEGKIRVVRTTGARGNKSYAQEYGLGFVTGDVLVMSDADTLLHPDFIRYIEEDMADPTNEEKKAAPPATPDTQGPKLTNRGKAKISVSVELDLDDAAVFNLKGEGIKTVTVVSN